MSEVIRALSKHVHEVRLRSAWRSEPPGGDNTINYILSPDF